MHAVQQPIKVDLEKHPVTRNRDDDYFKTFFCKNHPRRVSFNATSSRIPNQLLPHAVPPHSLQQQHTMGLPPSRSHDSASYSNQSLSSLLISSPTPSPRRMSLPSPNKNNILLTTCAMAGVAICYSAQINLGTPHLLHLGLPTPYLSLAWLAGPLSGLIVQPIVGYFSDICTHPLGRRRPFLISGAFLTALSLVIFANSHRLANLLVDPAFQPTTAIIIAVIGFFCLDFCIQAVQAPLRALVTDVFADKDRHRANSLLALFTGVGNLAGGALCGAHSSRWVGGSATDVDTVFVSAAVGLLVTVALCAWATHEKVFSGKGRDAKRAWSGSLGGGGGRDRMWELLAGVPSPFWDVFCVQLCTWCGFFTLLVYLNTWVGLNVFAGDAGGDALERALFASGVRFGGIANALMAVVTIAYSAALPKLVRRWGVRPLYAFSQGVEAVCLMLAPFLRGGRDGPSGWLKAVVLVDVGMIGVVWATTIGLPWTLIGNALESDERYAQKVGLFTTLFNASQSFPQLIVAFVAYPVLKVVEDCSAVMFLGGICAAVGGVLVMALRIEDVKKIPEREEGGLPRSGSGAKFAE